MKVNIVLPAIGRSGGIDVIYKYAELMTKAGHDVVIYKEVMASNMHRYNNCLKNFLHQVYCSLKGIIVSQNKNSPFDKFVFRLDNRTVREADVVIATAWPTAFRINKLDENKGKKFYFIQGYEVWDNVELAKKSYMLFLNKIVISTWINQKMNQELGIGPFPIVYNGIDTTIYHKIVVEKNDKENFFLMLNHTLPKKGVENGLQVFENIKKKYKNCKLRMFGTCSGDNLPSYVEYYQNPSKDKIVELYSSSDIFIFPSLEEGWGLTLIEALACGCIVVATNTGCVLDIGKDKENMMISEPGDIQEMIRNIEKLLDDSDLQNKLSCCGSDTICELDWEKSCKKLLSTLLD